MKTNKKMKKKEYTLDVAGLPLIVQFTDLADQTNGSVLVKYGNTTILATAVMSERVVQGGDFLPLTVDYEERFYASGRILGSRYLRREGKPSDEAILSGRIVDRTIRPLFDQRIRNEVQVVIMTLSLDEYDPDVLAVIGASLALGVSDIPWNGPVSAIRIGKIKENSGFEINPSYAKRGGDNYEFDLVACGKDKNINMIEIGGKEITEQTTVEALKKASEEVEKIQEFQKQIIKEIGKKKRILEFKKLPDEIVTFFKSDFESKLPVAVFSGPGHEMTNKLIKEWEKSVKEKFGEMGEENILLALSYFDEQVNTLLHREAIKNDKRPDGRKMDEVRPLFVQAGGISPVLHGSGLFYRGGTHVLSVLTLGGPQDSQIIEGAEVGGEKRYIHHYNFPPFSSGETGRMGGTNRRMIGHGALAEKALEPVLPSQESFPYTIRIVSESLASNGSTSMASTCGSSIALMDAGVPIKAPVAGIASGLMMESGESFKVLTDIQGPEDHHGDMDFKVTGTRAGITAVQMDVKVGGVPINILEIALEKAKNARVFILDEIEKVIKEPRKEISPNAPKIISIKINEDQIGGVIGPGGKMIKEIKKKTGADIDIKDDGTIFLTGKGDVSALAKQIIEDMTKEYKIGEKFDGVITKIVDFGAFVRIGSNTEGLLHISEMAPFRIDRVDIYLKENQTVPVTIKDIDERGRIKLSIKDVQPNFIKKPEGYGGVGGLGGVKNVEFRK